jgi:predicted MPP superfamily phosphohydrolase
MISFLRAYKPVIVFGLVFAYSVFLLIYPSEFGRDYGLLIFTFVTLIASQIFWIRRVLDLGERFLPGKPGRGFLAVVATLVYLFFFIYNFGPLTSSFHILRVADARLGSVLMEGSFWWWLVGSWAGFGLVIVFWTADSARRSAAWLYRKARDAAARHFAALQRGVPVLDPPSPDRRRFLQQTFVAVSATPFLATGYGLLYGRLDVEVTRLRIRLAGLPAAFEGFRIAQLSDFHISPFLTANEIRRCVTITNRLKPDLIVMTGDFVAWDPEAEGEVVQALSGLRAPCGVFGCLGNHETETQTEDSITRLFAAQNVRILRQEHAPIRLCGETLNLIGVDDSLLRLRGVESLMMSDTVNILLSHDPDNFDRAAQLGIDLTLAGHTHGGQLSLEFLRRGLCLSRFETPYVSGWYEKPSGQQLYVNRGIGTTGFPIRLGARPEITVLELSRT